MKLDFQLVVGILVVSNFPLLIVLLHVKTYWYYKVVQFRRRESVQDWFQFIMTPSFKKSIYAFDVLLKEEDDTQAIARLRSKHNWLYFFIVGDFISIIALSSILD